MPSNGTYFNRPPRLQAAPIEAELDLPSPSSPSKPSTSSMISALLPMGGLVVIAFVYLMIGGGSGGAIALPMIMMLGLSAVTGVVGFSLQRNQQRINALEQRLDYERQVERRLARAQAGIDLQRDLLQKEYPTATTLTDLIRNRSDRLWTRRPDNTDFGAVRLGLGAVRSRVHLRLPDPDGNAPNLRRTVDEGFSYQWVQNAPIVLTLGTSGSIGIVGERSRCVPLMYGLIAQLATFQAPDVLQLYLISSKAEYPTWQWMRWLPHSSADGNGGFPTNLAFDEQAVRHLLLHLNALLDVPAGEAVDPVLRVLVVENLALVRDDPTFVRLLTHSGVTALCLADTLAQAPGDCSAVLHTKETTFTLRLTNDTGQSWTGSVETFPRSQVEILARNLASFNLPGREVNSRIPASVSLLDVFDQSPSVEALAIDQRWSQASTRAAQALLPFPVPIGRRSFSDTLWLHLSDEENAQGPHMELGGTTGYGKSVLLETYVTAMAIEHPPQFLNFMLFDFKGGNTFEPFRNLPHTVGVITNLDPTSGGSAEIEAQRALVALSAERRRRETLLRGYKDIHAYYRKTLIEPGIPLESWKALPFLVVIVDEFAELLRQMPAFLKELVSTVRLGRTSGMHLILATQNPAADVSGDIRSNLKSHILLRVNAETDSQTVLKTPAAARISTRGRAFIQSGSEAAIEFQTASSRGPYQPEDNAEDVSDVLLHDIEQIVAPRRTRRSTSVRSTTIMSAVIDTIHEISQWWPMPATSHVLPDPLPANLALEELLRGESFAWDSARGIWRDAFIQQPVTRAPFGMIDDIEAQTTRHLEFHLDDEADHWLFASPRSFGKTTALLSLARSLAAAKRPDEVMIYGLNFSGRGLDSLENLPHVGAVINKEEIERIDRLFIWLEEEMERRAHQLSVARQVSIWQYNAWTHAITPEQRTSLPYLPPIVILLDGGAEFANSYLMQSGDFMSVMNQVARLLRDGRNLGILFVITTSNSSDLPDVLMKLLPNHRVVMGVSTPMEYVGYFGAAPERATYFRPGAGLLSGTPVLGVQIALPGTMNDLSALIALFTQMKESAIQQGITSVAASIEALPGDVRLDGDPPPRHRVPTRGLHHCVPAVARTMMGVYSIPQMVLGVNSKDQAPLVVDLRAGSHFVIASAPQSGKTTLLKTFVYGAAALNSPAALQITIIDANGEFSPTRRLPHVQWLTSGQEIKTFLQQMVAVATHRSAQIGAMFKLDSDIPIDKLSAMFPPHLVVIDNYDRLSMITTDLNPATLTQVAQSANRTRIHFVVSIPASGYTPDQLISYLVAKRSGLAIGSIEAVNILGRVTSALMRQKFPTGRGYLIQQDSMTLAQFARIGDENVFARELATKWSEEVPLSPQLTGKISPDADASVVSESISVPPLTDMVATPQTDFHSILDEPFDLEAEMSATLEYLKKYHNYENIPDVQDVLAQLEQQNERDRQEDETR